MQRVCFLLKLKKDRIQDYLKAHDVWPEMLAAITRAGIRNYSLFLRPDGLVVGYFEAEDPMKSLRELGETDVNRRWQEMMAEFFEKTSRDLETGAPEWLEQYFYLP